MTARRQTRESALELEAVGLAVGPRHGSVDLELQEVGRAGEVPDQILKASQRAAGLGMNHARESIDAPRPAVGRRKEHVRKKARVVQTGLNGVVVLERLQPNAAAGSGHTG